MDEEQDYHAVFWNRETGEFGNGERERKGGGYYKRVKTSRLRDNSRESRTHSGPKNKSQQKGQKWGFDLHPAEIWQPHLPAKVSIPLKLTLKQEDRVSFHLVSFHYLISHILTDGTGY